MKCSLACVHEDFGLHGDTLQIETRQARIDDEERLKRPFIGYEVTMFLSESPLLEVTIISCGAMLIGSAIRGLSLRSASREKRSQRLASLATWWTLLVLLLAACWLQPWGILVLIGIASGLGIDEFLRMTSPDVGPNPRRLWATSLVIIGMSLVAFSNNSFQIWLPLVAIWSLVLPHILGDTTQNYLAHVGFAFWGIMILVWGLGHAAWLGVHASYPSGPLNSVGWFLLLILLTELNDIAQAIVGRAIGKRPILPHISPNKTWEGLVGGMTVTTCCGVGLCAWLTPEWWSFGSSEKSTAETFGLLGPILGSLVISVSGFIGDLNMSCVKRDVGVKDGSDLLPGQGGIVDRIDSLSFTAPAFVAFLSIWFSDG